MVSNSSSNLTPANKNFKQPNQVIVYENDKTLDLVVDNASEQSKDVQDGKKKWSATIQANLDNTILKSTLFTTCHWKLFYG